MRVFSTLAAPRRAARVKLMATTILVGGMMLGGQAPAQTLPSGGQVVAGQAVIGNAGGRTVISQSSDKAIVNWTDFSIGQGGEVDFDNGAGATLNRVTGGNLSSLDGVLKATGSVYLINPNGVIIGKNGVVSVGGDFVASALDVSNASFLSGGDLTFSGPSLASVVNLGKIGALGGDVALMAVDVRNGGEIDAANGTAGLIAGRNIIMRDSSVDDGRFLVVTGGSDTAATNDGMIAAAAAELRAEGGNVYALAGNTEGVIRATGVADKGGRIWLTAGEAGSAAVSGSALTAGDGAGDGGAITVAGGQVTVASDATLDASATGAAGHGGAISVIADKTAGDLTFAGTALAKGGEGGGQVETSGARVDFDGARVDASAVDGPSGVWLIDPYDLTVDAAAAATLSGSLDGGTSISLQTTASGTSGPGTANAAGNGDIFVNSDISWSSIATLTLDAYRSVQFNANVTATGAGSVVIKTNDGGSGGDYAFAQGKSLSLTTSGILSINRVTYTLISDLSGLQAINSTDGQYALVNNLSPGALTDASDVIDTLTPNTVLTGLGHTIDGLNLTADFNNSTHVYYGLVGDIKGVVRDLGLTNLTVNAVYSGMYADYNHGLDGTGAFAGIIEPTGALKNVWATGGASGFINAGESGGLVGYNYGLVSNSYAAIDVTSYGASGGLAAYNYGTISNTYATGNVVSTNLAAAGGLVGQNADDGGGVPASRYGLGGGIIDSYSTGTVSGNVTGGLVGLNSDASLSNSTGAVTDSYWNTTTSGLGSSAAGTGLSTSDFQNGNLPSGFSASVWTVSSGAYPQLSSFVVPAVSYQTVGGMVYDGGGSAASGATVTLYSGGSLIGTSSGSASDGTYSISLTPGTITSSTAVGGLLTLSGASGVSGLIYTDAPVLTGGNLSGFDLHAGLIDLTTGASGYIALQSLLNTTFGTTNLSGALAAITNPDYRITASGAFTLDADLTGGGAVAIKSGGDLTIANPVTVSGGKALTLDAHDNLYVDANLTASDSDAVTIKTADGGAGDYYFALGDSLSFTGTGGSLNINGAAYTLLYSLSDLGGISGGSGDYALASSLDASGATYTASVVGALSGVLTGLGHGVDNLTVNAVASNVGLIGSNTGTVRDIGVTDAVIDGVGNTGGLVGWNGGAVRNAWASATVSGSASGDNTGGLVGWNAGTVDNSFATGAASGRFYVGSLVGRNSGSGAISNAFAMGTATAASVAGGLVGYMGGGSISNVYALGNGFGTSGLVGNAGGTSTATNAYYNADTNANGALGANGANVTVGALTTAQLQGALPSGFSSSVWGTGSGLYPYLKTFYPNGLQAISGAATTGGAAAALAQVTLYSGGARFDAAYTGDNGAYYIIAAPGTIASSTALGALLTLNGGSVASGLSYANSRTLSNGDVAGFDIGSGQIAVSTSATTFSGLQSLLGATFGTSNLSSALTGIGVPDYNITASGAFKLDTALTGGGAVAIKTGGDLTIAKPVTVKGGKALTLDSHNNIYVDANLTASDSDAVTIKTANGGAGDYYFALGDSLNFTGTGGSLNINGAAYTPLYSLSDLAGISGVSGHYALAASLDASGAPTYTAAVITTLSGQLTGLGHTISNLSINSTNAYVGLIGQVSSGSTVRDIGLINAQVTGTNNYLSLLAGNSVGAISNVFVSGVLSGGSSSKYVGSVAGQETGAIKNSFATASVSGGDSVGGLVGYLALRGRITSAYASGPVSGTNAGSLVGRLYDESMITTSYATGYGATLVGISMGGVVSNSYWDIQTSGVANGHGGAGKSTTQLQGTLPAGFSSSPLWATGSGLYPYLKTFYPNGAQAITGTAKDSGGAAVRAAQVTAYAGGASLGVGYSGVNGYYYILTAPHTVSAAAGVAETLSGATGVSGAAYTEGVSLASGNVTGLNVTAGQFALPTTDTTFSALSGHLSSVFGGATASGLLASGLTARLTTNGAFAFDQAATFGGGLDVAATGGITLSQNLTTGGTTSFDNAVTLGGDVTLQDTSGSVAFASTVDGAYGLTINSGGATSFNGAVGGTAALGALTTDAGGSTTLNGDVTTTGAQSFGDAVTLGGDVTLSATGGGAVSLSGTVDGAYALTVDTAGATRFSGAVGGTAALSALTTDAAGATQLDGDVTTTGAQTYNDAVTLGGDRILGSTGGGAIAFNTTLDGAYSLNLNTSGATILNGAVGGTTALSALTTDAGGSTQLDGEVTTTGAQSFGDAVSLLGDAVLTAGGALSLAAVDGANRLTLKGASLSFNGVIGGTTRLSALTGAATAGDITVGGQINVTHGIVLAANGVFTNTAGASALNAGDGFTIYTQNAADPTGTLPVNDFGGLTATNYYNDAYDFSAGTFASAVPAGDHFVYAYAVSLTPTLSGSAGKTYDAGVTADTSGLSVAAGTLLSADDSVTLIISGARYDDKNAGTGKTVTADIAFASNPNNYALSSPTAAAAVGSIDKAALTLAAATDTKTYDANADSTVLVSVGGLQGADTVTGLAQSFDSKNAGSRTLSVNSGYIVNDGNSGGNYTVTTQTASGTIAKAALTLSAVTDTKTYDANVDSAGTVSVSGLQGSDTVTGLTQSFDSKNAGSRTLSVNGGYAVNDGNSGGNYTVTAQTASGTIGRAALTLAAGTDTKTYDANADSTATVSVSGLQGSDTVTGLAQSFDSKNAGSRTLSVNGGYAINDGDSGGNYAVTTQTASGVINKAALTLAAATDTKTYDANVDSAGAVSVSGLQGSDTVTGLTQSFDAKNAGSRTLSINGGYAVNDGNSGGNYTITTQTASGTIAKAALTLAAATDTKTYDANANSAGTVSVSGLQGSDTVTGLTQSFDSKNAGSRTLNVNSGYVVNDGNSGGNYAVTTQTALGTIAKAALTLAAAADTKTYDTTAGSAGTVSVSGLQGSDTVTGLSQSFDSKNAGSRTLIVNGGYIVNDGNSGGNYAVTTRAASGTIDRAALILAAASDTKTYDAATGSTGAVGVSGLQGSDTVTGLSQSFDSKNAGFRTLIVNGGYVVNDGDSGGNYAVTTQTASGSIAKAALTAGLTGVVEKVYDATADAGLTAANYTLSGSGVMRGDDVALNAPSAGVYAGKDAGSGRSVSVGGIALTGVDAGNYTVNASASADIGVIDPRPITVAADDLGKIVGAADPALTWKLASGDLVGGDVVTGGLTRASGETPGDYAITQGSLAASSNYKVTFTGATFTITSAGLQNQPVVNPAQTVAAPPPSPAPDNGSGSSSSGGSGSGGSASGQSAGGASGGADDPTDPGVGHGSSSSEGCGTGEACSNQPYPGNQQFSSYVSFLSH